MGNDFQIWMLQPFSHLKRASRWILTIVFFVCKRHPRNPGWLGRICSFWFMLNNILSHAALSVCRNTKPPVWNGKTTAGDLGSIPVNDESSHLHGCQTPILHNCSIHHGAKMLNMRFTQVLCFSLKLETLLRPTPQLISSRNSHGFPQAVVGRHLLAPEESVWIQWTTHWKNPRPEPGTSSGASCSPFWGQDFYGSVILLSPVHLHFSGTLWWTNILLWKITIFNGKIHYFYGHVQLLFVCSPEGNHRHWNHLNFPWCCFSPLSG